MQSRRLQPGVLITTMIDDTALCVIWPQGICGSRPEYRTRKTSSDICGTLVIVARELRQVLIKRRTAEYANSSKIWLMTDVTEILSQIENGDAAATDRLLPIVYDELRKLAASRLAREESGQTLQATALVHEAYLRLVGNENVQHWDCSGHFFAAAAESMRRILINRARDKNRLKRGGGLRQLNLDQIELALDTPDDELIALDEAMQLLEEEDPLGAELVKLRFFAGFSQHQAAASLKLAPRTADRHWAYARAWLFNQLNNEIGLFREGNLNFLAQFPAERGIDIRTSLLGKNVSVIGLHDERPDIRNQSCIFRGD